MKTLVLVAHPQVDDSATQEFLKTSADYLPEVIWHPIDALYQSGHFDQQREQQLLWQFDRIIFQFPMYWYSAPASLKQYMDDVFTRNYVIAKQHLKGTELGLAISLGDAVSDFQAGGREKFTISELMRPFEAFANKAGMVYLKPFIINQFGYLTPAQKETLLADYLMYLDAKQPLSLENREQWLVNQLAEMGQQQPKQQATLQLISEGITGLQDELEDLKNDISMMRDQEE